MNFSSVTFIFIFLPIFLIIYYLVPKKAENYILVIGSILFYAWGEPILVLLLVVLALINYIIGRLFQRFTYDRSICITLLIVGLAINTAVLLFGKNIPNIGAIISKFGSGSSWLNSVPLGLSFYVLSCVSYIVDIYLNKETGQKNFIKYMVYISMFPKLLAGPIVPYRNMYWQIDNRTINTNKIFQGIVLFIKGLGKKVLIADNISILCNQIFDIFEKDPSQISVATAWIGAIALLIQIYFDFAGYTDMARGLGKMMGFQFPKNLHFPLMARTVTDYFKRCHISLARWIKTYIYNPLNEYCLNKTGRFQPIVSLTVIIAFVSVWHGIGKNFQSTAIFYFIILLGEYFFWGDFFRRIPAIFGRIYTLFITLIAIELLFHSSFSMSLKYLMAMFGLNGGLLYDNFSVYYFITYLPLLLISMFITSKFLRVRANRIKHFYPILYGWLTPVGCAILFLLSTAFLINSTETTSFIYFLI